MLRLKGNKRAVTGAITCRSYESWTRLKGIPLRNSCHLPLSGIDHCVEPLSCTSPVVGECSIVVTNPDLRGLERLRDTHIRLVNCLSTTAYSQ